MTVIPVQKVEIEDEMKKSYIDYAMSVIVGRAIPDVRDGLKPVHRRILFSMFQSNFTHTQPHHKCARIVGDCLGKYHPHGDIAVYDSLVRMAQDFSLRYPLIDGQGNFGSVDGDPPAAMRYTEARLARIASEMLEDLNRDTVEFVPNFDESLTEPTCLPSKLPNLLINGTTGIAVGMATNMPPYNLREICDAIVKVVDNPDSFVEELLDVIQGPDFPTGGFILGRNGIRNAIKTGRGKLVVRARAEIDEEGSHPRIIVTEIPYQVNKAKLVENIGELINEKKIEGIRDLRDESDRNGFRIVIDLKKDVAPNVVLNHLYKHTQLQITFGVTNLVLTNRGKKPEVLNVLDIIREFIAHREEVITRRAMFELNKANTRLHLVEGLLLAVTNIDEIVRLIRESQDPAEAENKLATTPFADVDAIVVNLQSASGAADLDLVITITNKVLWNLTEMVDSLKNGTEDEDLKPFLERLGISDLTSFRDFADTYSNPAVIRAELKKRAGDMVANWVAELQAGENIKSVFDLLTNIFLLTATQAHEILNMRLARLTALQIDELKAEEGELQSHIIDLEDITDRRERRMIIIKEETVELRETYGDDRRTEITRDEEEKQISQEDLVKEESVVIMLTQNHYIKRMPLSEYQAQRRGGKGRRGIKVSGEDFVRDMFVCSSHDTIMFFTTTGRVYAEQAYMIPEMSRNARGKSIANFLQLESEAKINNLIPINDFEAKLNLILVTRLGQVKKTPVKLFKNIRKPGLPAIKLRENDELIDVKLTGGESNIIIATKHGMAIKFEETDVRPMGRSTMGVRGIRLREGDEVVGMVVAFADESFTTVTRFGYGKRSPLENYRLTGRGCLGVINMKFYESGDEVVAVKAGTDKQEIIVATKKGIVLRTSNEFIRMIGRVGKGVKIVRLDEGDEVVAVAVAEADVGKPEEESEIEEDPAQNGDDSCKLDLNNSPSE